MVIYYQYELHFFLQFRHIPEIYHVLHLYGNSHKKLGIQMNIKEYLISHKISISQLIAIIFCGLGYYCLSIIL